MSSGSFFGDIIRNPFSFTPIEDARKKRRAEQTKQQEEAKAKAASASSADAEAKIAAEKEAEGRRSSKQAAAFLASRNAQGFGSNPNTAKSFLLSL